MKVAASIAYRTFPHIEVAGRQFQTFGLMSAIGIALGAAAVGLYVRRRSALDFQTAYLLAIQLAIAGIVGARLTWVITHYGELRSPTDAVSLWHGGMQFSGGFLGAFLAAQILLRRHSRSTRWIFADGLVMGLGLGLALGRVGCIAVGEHFGRRSDAWFVVRYDGGVARETRLGDHVLQLGDTFHHTAVYELLMLVALTAGLAFIARRASIGQLTAIFCLAYGVFRFLIDFLRVNDERLLGLTGAQFLMIAIVAGGVWIWRAVVPSLRRAKGSGVLIGAS